LFTTFSLSRNDVLKLLHSAYLIFKKNVIKIRHRQEFSIKVFADIEKLKNIVSNDEEMMNRTVDIARQLNETLKQTSDDMVLDEQITQDMIMNASYLIHKNDIQKFYEEINNFDKKHTEFLKIRISGPTAPYNFVNMPTR